MKNLKKIFVLFVLGLTTACNYHYTHGGANTSGNNSTLNTPDPGTTTGTTSGTTTSPPTTVVTYSDVQSQVFSVSCQSCHDQRGIALNFNSYQNVYSYASQIKADAVTQRSMPPSSSPQLSAIQLQALKTWLDEGAPLQ